MVEIQPPGLKTGKGKAWTVPSKGLDREFAADWQVFYVLCAASATVRERTSEWLRLMRETKDTKG